MPIVVITPASRPHNWGAIIDRLEGQGITWVPILDGTPYRRDVFNREWIKPAVIDTWRGEDACYGKLNEFIGGGLEPRALYHILADDDLVPINFYRQLGDLASDITVVSMERGQRQPRGSHPTSKLWAAPANMRVNAVGLEQIIYRGSVLQNLRFEDISFADGLMAEKLIEKYPDRIRYRPEFRVFFNALEPGRWSEVPT